MGKKISNMIAFSFAWPILAFGVVASIGGIIGMTQNPLFGGLAIIAGGFLCSSTYGSQIDLEKNLYREYTAVYGIKRGKWFPLEKMPYLCVLPSRTGTTMYSQSNRATTVIDDTFDICLLNETHRRKIVWNKMGTKNLAVESAETLAKQIGKSVVQYSPVLSDKTRNRRR
ncbi:MAG: hypothetical protein ACI837_001207 [Crocinitomicaceae bacterium]|jgi:hypothetical protein